MKCSKWERRKKRPNKAKAKWNLPEAKNIWYPTNCIDLVEIYRVYTEYFLVNYSIISKEYIQKQTNLIYFSGSATPTWLYNPLNYSTTLQGYSQQGCKLAQAAFISDARKHAMVLFNFNFLPPTHSFFSHYYLPVHFPLNLTLTLLSTCNSMSFCSLKRLAMWWQSFKVITWARCRRRHVVVPSNCSSILFGAVTVNATATSCLCVCVRVYLCPCPPLLNLAFSPQLSSLSGVALSTRQLNAKCRIVNTSFHCLPVSLFSLSYPGINSRCLHEGCIGGCFK